MKHYHRRRDYHFGKLDLTLPHPPTYAGKRARLEAVARTCGGVNVVTYQDVDKSKAQQAAIDRNKMAITVNNYDCGDIKLPAIAMVPVVFRDRFMKLVFE